MADRALLLVCGLCFGTAWATDEAPDATAQGDVEFIEYLGMWEESDDEWLMLDEEQESEDAPAADAEMDNES